jgi:anti-sigma-K factor RskA
MEKQIRSADYMFNSLIKNPAQLDQLKINPVSVLQQHKDIALMETSPSYTTDKWVYRIAVLVLSILAVVAAGGSIFLVSTSQTTPEVLVALGSAAVGALVGLFAPVPGEK